MGDYRPKVTISPSFEVRLPVLPNYLKAVNGIRELSIPIQDVSDSDLKRLGEAWTQKLVEYAQSKRSSLTKESE